MREKRTVEKQTVIIPKTTKIVYSGQWNFG
jgi:hypothetical protein